jgi:hypothetical protein
LSRGGEDDVLRAGRSTDLGIAVSTITALAILVIFVFPLFSRSDEPARPRKAATAASLQQAPAAVALGEPDRVMAGRPTPPVEASSRQSLIETSLGLTLILGVALLAMAVGSRGRPG